MEFYARELYPRGVRVSRCTPGHVAVGVLLSRQRAGREQRKGVLRPDPAKLQLQQYSGRPKPLACCLSSGCRPAHRRHDGCADRHLSERWRELQSLYAALQRRRVDSSPRIVSLIEGGELSLSQGVAFPHRLQCISILGTRCRELFQFSQLLSLVKIEERWCRTVASVIPSATPMDLLR